MGLTNLIAHAASLATTTAAAATSISSSSVTTVMGIAGNYPELFANPLAICVSFFSILGTLTIGISVLPQTLDTIKNRQTQTFPVLMYWFLFIGCACLGIYGIGLVQAGWATQAGYSEANNVNYITQILFAWAGQNASNTDWVISSNGTYTLTAAGASAAAAYLADYSFAGSYNDMLTISPAAYAQYAISDSTPGGMLIIGEFFASITSGIVLWIKYDNQMKAKKAGLTEAEYCTKYLADKKAAKLAKRGVQQ